ncbi:essential MCU regulator, mitochondrial-like [Prorops nasuta]|uniref:essential MCU regulator, mitochondrial-like n=1 Tax=Prorops nasuta TaxID=863751 RepID=UPI0034CDB4F7
MITSRFICLMRQSNRHNIINTFNKNTVKNFHHNSITTQSGAILPEPERARFGFYGVITSVIVGLITGATFSKYMANFLEENDLFVPTDDDDDDD